MHDAKNMKFKKTHFMKYNNCVPPHPTYTRKINLRSHKADNLLD